MADIEKVNVPLWRQDAVVLFDWLQGVDLNAVPIEHPAQKQALADLLNSLEVTIEPPTEEAVDAARAEVARDMGW